MIKGVIFDFDGVLIDSERYTMELYKKLFKKYGVRYTKNFYARVAGINRKDETVILEKLFKDNDKLEAFFSELRICFYSGVDNGEIPLKNGAIEIINYLKRENIKFILASSSRREGIERCLLHSDFKKNPFEKIVTSAQVERGKPYPDIFLLAAKELNLDIKDCLIVEDSYKGTQAAISSGGVSVMVPDIYKPIKVIEESVDYIKKDLFEVIDLIKQINRNI